MSYSVAVRALCEFTAKVGDLAPGFREVCLEALAGMDAFLGRMGG